MHFIIFFKTICVCVLFFLSLSLCSVQCGCAIVGADLPIATASPQTARLHARSQEKEAGRAAAL